MKLRINCPKCIGSGEQTVVKVEPTNDGRFEATCSAGHHFKTTVGYHDFQILFEIGVNAIHDGYYREAVGSIAASYERFLEFFIRIVAKKSEIEASAIDDAWKAVGKQSERQLGAFVFLYLTSFKEAPKLLPNSRVTFRNEVIHKGKIPDRANCIKYGDAVQQSILSVLRKLWATHQREVISSINDKAFPEGEPMPESFFLPWMTLPTNREPTEAGEERDLESLLEGVAKVREMG